MKKFFSNSHYLPIVVILGLIAYLFTKAGDLFSPADDRGNVEPPRPTNGATITDDMAYAISEELFLAMQKTFGVRFTNLKIAWAKMKNVADYNKVFHAFGEQHYNRFSGATLANSDMFDPALNLTEWLKAELNDSQVNELKKMNLEINVL